MNRDPDENVREQALKIMEALSGVDEELLVRCDEAPEDRGAFRTAALGEGGRRRKAACPQGRPIWRLAGAWAAVLCLAVAGMASWRGYWLLDNASGDSSGGGLQQKSGEAYDGNGMHGSEEAEMNGCSPGADPEGANGGTIEEWQLSGGVQTDVGAAGTEKDIEGYDAAQDGAVNDKKESCREEGAGKEGAAGEAGSQSDSQSDSGENIMADVCPRLNAIEYTEQEARQLEGLGAYVPKTLPEGYVFEGAYSNQDLERENLTVSWSRGMDLILLRLEWAQGTVETVDTGKPETYDQRLYEIPYGETVPDEYRQTFQNPVFALEDLSPEILESRMLVYEDRGDTATPRGNFGVLYPDGVLVFFNGRGTAQEIWEMFSSVKQ